MNKKLTIITLLSALSISTFATQFIIIGTGGVTGVYYPTGGAICKMVNRIDKKVKIKCSVESTGGSVYNVTNIANGELDFGISQSDTAYRAYHGLGEFKGKAITQLRSVMAIYPELLTLVVAKKSGIKTLQDIKGKRINIDTPGSGTRMTDEIILKAFGIRHSDLKSVGELPSSEGPTLLKKDLTDGYFGVFGHPATNIKDAANAANIDIISIQGRPVDELVKKYPYYAKGVISGTFYRGVTHDTPSIGVKAVLCTNSKVSDKLVYTIVKTILDNFKAFKKLNPAYRTITKKSLLDGLSIPQDPGAIRAFKEAGLL